MQHNEVIHVSLKLELMESWIAGEWIPQHPDQEMQTIMVDQACVNHYVLGHFNRDMVLAETHTFAGSTAYDCPALAQIASYSPPDHLSLRTGASLYHFVSTETSDGVDILVLSSYFSDNGHMACVAAVPRDFLPVWTRFASECHRIAHAMRPLFTGRDHRRAVDFVRADGGLERCGAASHAQK